MFIQRTTGNVGIGTTGPNQMLQIHKSTGAGLQISGNNATDNSLDLMETTTGGEAFGEAGTGAFRFIYDGGDNKLYLKSGNELVVNTRLTVERDSGNVGIGTTGPTSLLHAVDTMNAATGNEIAYNLAYTTNKLTSGNDTGLLIAMTDTASPGTSKLLDLQKGGATQFNVDESGNVYIKGDLTTQGTQIVTNTVTVDIANNKLVLNTNQAGTPTQDAMIEVERGTPANAYIKWNESSDKWTMYDGTTAFDIGAIYTAANDIDISGANAISLEDDVDASALRASSASGLGLYDDGSNLGVFIEDGGQVGIGTTTPGYALDVDGHMALGTTGQGYLFSNVDNQILVGADSSYYLFSGSGASTKDINIGNRMYVNGSNLGIGTTNPIAKLVVNGTTFINQTTDYFGIASTKVQISSGNTNNNIGWHSNGVYHYSWGNTAAATYNFGDGNNKWILRKDTGANPDFDIASTGSGAYGNIMTLKHASGNVGIKTTNPVETFHANGTSWFTGKMDIGSAQTSSALATVMSVIKTSTGNIFEYTDNNNDNWVMSNPSDGIVEVGPTTSTTRMDFQTNDLARVTIESGGDVGIGTTNPLQKLHVNGNIVIGSGKIGFNDSVTSWYIHGAGTYGIEIDGWYGAALLAKGELGVYVDPYASVGIGTSAPEATLDIAGPLRVGSASDVGIAHDLYFENTTSAAIDSYGPLTITSGHPNANYNLVLKGTGTGKVYIDDDLEITGTTTFPSGLTVASGNISASSGDVSAASGTGTFGNITFSGNTMSTTTGNITIDPAASGVIYFQGGNYYINASGLMKAENFEITDTGNKEGFRWDGGAEAISIYTTGQGGYNAFQFDTTSTYPYAFMGNNVGIGTTGPIDTLQTIGSALFGDVIATADLNSTILANVQGATLYDSSGDVEDTDLLYLRKGTGTGSKVFITFGSAAGGQYYVGSRMGHYRTAGNSQGGLVFETKPDDAIETTVERMRITDSGNVGIGTTGPSGKLDVSVANSGNTVTAEFNQLDSTNNPNAVNIINAGNGYALDIDNNGYGRAMRLTQLGNDYALAIDSEATGYGSLLIEGDTITTGSLINVSDADVLTTGKIANFVSGSTDTSVRSLVHIESTNGNAVNTTALHLSATGGYSLTTGIGNVGIGTTAPNYPLEVMGTASTSRLLLPQKNEAATPTLAFGDGDTGFYEAADDYLSISLVGARVFFFDHLNSTFRSNLSTGPGIINEVASNVNPTLLPDNSDINTGIGQAGTEIVSIIGNGVELARFDGSAGTATTTIYEDLIVNTNLLVVDSTNGNVGIGTTGPGQKLDVEGNINVRTSHKFLLAGNELAMPSDEDLIGYWAFDDGAGTTAVDGIGQASDGTLPASDWGAGQVGKAGRVASSYFNAPITSSAPMTTALWFKVATDTDDVSSNTALFYWYQDGSNYIHFDNYSYGGAQAGVPFLQPRGYVTAYSHIAQNFLADQWYFAVFKLATNQMFLDIYKDGDIVWTKTSPVDAGFASYNFSALRLYGLGSATYYDDVRVYDRILNEAEIKALQLYSAVGTKVAKINAQQLGGDITVSGGNVGIGTTSTSAKLEVYDSSYTNAEPALMVSHGRKATHRTYDTAIISQDDVTTLRLVEDNGASADQELGISIGDGEGVITSTEELDFYTGSTPGANIYSGASGTLVMRLATNGRVGIGTQSPVARTGYSNTWLTISDSSPGIAIVETGETNKTKFIATNAGTLRFGNMNDDGTSPSDQMVIQLDGNVGISDTTPGYKLEVNGTGKFNNFLTLHADPTSDMYAATKQYVDDQNSSPDPSTYIYTVNASFNTGYRRYLVFDTALNGTGTNITCTIEMLYGGGSNAPRGSYKKRYDWITDTGNSITNIYDQVEYATGYMNNFRLGDPEVNGSSKIQIPIYTTGMGSGRSVDIKITIIGGATSRSYYDSATMVSNDVVAFPGNSYHTIPQRLGIGLGDNVMPAYPLDVGGAINASGNITGANLSGTNTGDDGTDYISEEEMNTLAEWDTQIGLTGTPGAGNFLRGDGAWTTVGSGTVTSVGGTAPVVSSGGTTPVISMAAATSSVHGYMTSTYATKLNGIEASADITDATNVAAAGAAMDGDFTSQGLMKRGASAGSYSIVTDNSSNWNTAYTDRLKWDGGSSGLTAATGRTSLGLGSAATRAAEDTLTNGSNLPDGAAITTYVTGLGHITDDTSVPKNHLANSGTLGFSWADSEVSNTLTASNLVTGSSVVADAEVDDSISINNTRLYAPTGAGNVGIGITDPKAKLDVAGDIRLSGGARNIEMDPRSTGAGYNLAITAGNTTDEAEVYGGNIYIYGGSDARETGGNIILAHTGSELRGSVGIGTSSPGSYRLYVSGNAYIGGAFSKASGSFLIDHPLDPANKVLRHSFVESPDMKNIYDGLVILDESGEAMIELPEYFDALNMDFRYQLTPVGMPAALYIKEEIKDNKFVIAGGKSGMKVSWQVTGSRKDAYALKHPIIVEEDKGPDGVKDKGEYLAPDCF